MSFCGSLAKLFTLNSCFVTRITREKNEGHFHQLRPEMNCLPSSLQPLKGVDSYPQR